MPITNCFRCRKLFYAKPVHIKRGFGKYCSIKCKKLSTRKRIIVLCATCGRKTEKTPSQLDHSKSGKFFCGKSCQTIWRNKEFTGPKHRLWKDGANMHRRILINSRINQICKLCRTKDLRVLAVHHIDENHLNNALTNLVWLCHNCHYLAHYDSLKKQRLAELLNHHDGGSSSIG
ncbi:MAG: HNH endonuclease signature motif containing protein [Candidatus Vogelbacteria bacterium]